MQAHTTTLQARLASKTPPTDAHGQGSRRATTQGKASPLAVRSERLAGPLYAPADLQQFLHAHSVRQAAQALGLSHGFVHHIRQGYWPEDPAKIMHAWRHYKCQLASQTEQIRAVRRVYEGGVIRHGGKHFAHPHLCGHEGSMVGICRTQEGQILAVVFGKGDAPNTYWPLQPL